MVSFLCLSVLVHTGSRGGPGVSGGPMLAGCDRSRLCFLAGERTAVALQEASREKPEATQGELGASPALSWGYIMDYAAGIGRAGASHARWGLRYYLPKQRQSWPCDVTRVW